MSFHFKDLENQTLDRSAIKSYWDYLVHTTETFPLLSS